MTSVEKLAKSLEILRIPLHSFSDEQRKNDLKYLNKKDKITHLNLIYENILAQNVREYESFSKYLGFAIEAFLVFFDDEDRDVYFVAEECLNKTFKSLMNNCLMRFPADLYRFMKKNGPERSLKAALTRFAEICHFIKPQKCRIYVDFMIKDNILSKIANRSEESIQSVLVDSMNRICATFCPSMSDQEIQQLIQSFLPNLSNNSSISSYRRASASCLSLICLYTASPLKSYHYLHGELLNLIQPIDENIEINKFKVWGVLLCFRLIIMHICELEKSSAKLIVNGLRPNSLGLKKTQKYFSLIDICQIYETCVYFLNNSDISIVTAALECIQVVLKLAPFNLHQILRESGNFTKSYLVSNGEQLELDSNSASTLLHSYDSSEIKSTLKQHSQDNIKEYESREQLECSSSPYVDQEFRLIQSPSESIGNFYDDKTSNLTYLIRFICFRFLLNLNKEQKLKSDNEVKILQKSIALDCCSSILTIDPALVFKPLTMDSIDVHIFDLFDYIKHQDDKMRTNACLLIGQFINTVLVNNCGNFDLWVSKHDLENNSNIKLEMLVNYLNNFILSENSQETNNICKRFALSAFRLFLPTLVKTNMSSFVLEILINLIQLKNSTYNLVKCELVDLLASIDFKSISFTEKLLTEQKYTMQQEESQEFKTTFFVQNTQERIIDEVFLDLIASEDSKIRFETARCITRFVFNCSFYEPTSIPFQNLIHAAGENYLKSNGFSRTFLNSAIMKNDVFNIGAIQDIFEKIKSSSTTKTKYYNSPLCSLSFPSNPWLSKNTQILINTFVQPFYSLIKNFPSNLSNSMTINNNLNRVVESNLNYIVPLLVNTLMNSNEKYQFLGCIESLDLIFQTYQPALYYSTNLLETTNILLSFIRHPNVFFDLYSHDILLRTIGNLFSSLCWLNMKKIDKLILQLDQLISNNRSNQTCQSLIDLITNAIKTVPCLTSLAEQTTGLTYFYSLSFNNQPLKNLIDSLFVHVTRVLCIFACVIDETLLPSNLTSNLSSGSTAVNTGSTQNNTVSTQMQSNQSSGSPNFIRSKISNLTDRKSDTSKEPVVVPLMTQLPKTTNSVYLGNFQNSSHYLKLYEVIKSAYSLFIKSPNFVSYDRFIQFLKTTLGLFAQLLEASLSVHEIAPHLDEILLYLRIIFTVEPASATKCVTLCLKSLFARNLAGLMFDYTQQQIDKLANLYETSQASTANQKSANLGQSPFLSGSLTSLTSFNLPSNLPFNMQFNASKRQSSLLTNLIQTNQAQFIKFMFDQTSINDQPLEASVNQGPSLINLAMDSLELSQIPSIASSLSQSAFSNSPTKSISKSNQSASNFSLLSLIKKPKQQSISMSQQNLSASQENKIRQLKTDQKTLSQYIKSFETIVLKSIPQYMMTSSVNLQTKILELLIQLILLNIDYGSLDGDKIFFDLILKQLESMEQKKVNENSKNYDPTSNSLGKSYMIDLCESFEFETVYLDPLNPFDLDAMLNKLYSHTENYSNSNNSYLTTSSTSPLICLLNLRQQEHNQAHLILPKIFEFLIELANSKQNTSKIVNKDPNSGIFGMSEIIRLCDNMIASENSFHTHVLSALRPVVIDLFLNRSFEDLSDLEMEHEVIIKTMLRFVHYPSIWPLLNLVILKLKKDSVNQWKKVSRQICDSIFDSIKTSKIKLLEFNGYEMRTINRYSLSYIPCIESTKSLIQLFNHLHSSVFRPIDFVILSLFEKAKELIFQEVDSEKFPYYLSLFILHLYLLFTNASEDQILFRLRCLTSQISELLQNDNNPNRRSSFDSQSLENTQTSSFTNSFMFNFDFSENAEHDFNDSALFLGNFLLKILDVSFLNVRKNLKFNPEWFISAQNLASSSNSGAFIRHYEMAKLQNLNVIQHLIANQLQILIYIITSEKFPILSNAISKLINLKSSYVDERKYRPDNLSENEKDNCEFIESSENIFNFNPSKFIFDLNSFILFKYSKINPLLSSLWQYFLINVNYNSSDYWYQALEFSESDLEDIISEESSQNSSLNTFFVNNDNVSKIAQDSNTETKSFYHKYPRIPTLNEKLFKYLSLIIYCDNLNSNQNLIDLPSKVSMLIIKNLVDLFEFAPYEPTIIDFFGSINRNAELSSLFIQSININWYKIQAKNELSLLESCLKAVEGIHLDSSGHLLSLLIEKFFKLPYLSLVRYADHIACQRVEMIHSLAKEELASLFTKKNLETLDVFYEDQAKNCVRHKRLFDLLEKLKQKQEEPSQSIIKTSASIEFFSIYLQNGIEKIPNDLDKEWFYNIVRSSCCFESSSDLINNSTSLKSKQCALILANLDLPNCESIIYDKSFKLDVLKDCFTISAFKTQNGIEKLPIALKQAKNLLKDFIQPLWLVSSKFLFSILSNLIQRLPELEPVSLSSCEENGNQQYKQRLLPSNPANNLIYDQKFSQITSEIDLYSQVLPLIESVNSYLKSIKEYPYLDSKLNQTDTKNFIKFSLFQIEYINFTTSNQNQIVSLKCLYESFLCVFNILSEAQFINLLSIDPLYSTLVSFLIKNLYQLTIQYFLKIGDENMLKTPRLKHLIDYTDSNSKYSNEVLFNLTTLETLLKIRFIINNQIFKQKIPFLMRDLVEKIYIALCRLPILDRFIRIPDCLWSQGFSLEYAQFLRSDTSVLPPNDNLKDPHVLKDHLRHILLIGWTTRNQFEYEYVNMLTFFHNISEDYYLPLSSQANSSKLESDIGQSPNHIMTYLPAEEIRERNKCISLLIKGLSTWLIKSTLTPRSGNSLNSLYEHVSRNKSPGFLSSYIGQQYNKLKKSIDSFDQFNIFTNLNSKSIASNSSLFYMLDPTLIDESDEKVKRLVDFTKPQPADSLTNLRKNSNKLSERSNLTYSTNIERVMLNNLPTNSNTFFFFTQISLEGILKFVGQWNRFDADSQRPSWIGESIQNFVSSQIDEVSHKLSDMQAANLNAPSVQSSSKSSYQSLGHTIQRSFNRNNLDIASVLRTILDYYESFFKIPSIQLKLDIFKSMIYLSNCLFDSKNQYESLSQKLQINFEFLNLFITQENEALMPIVNDLIDDSTLSLGIYGECLAKCCLHTTRDGQSMSSKDFERLNRLIENGLRSNSVLIKIATIQGLMYWLESISLGYLSSGNDAKILIDHLCKQVYLMRDSSSLFTSNYRYLSSLCSASFYIIENCLDSIRDAQNFCSTFIKLTCQILNDQNTPFFLFYQLYLGLERLFLSCMFPSNEIKTIQKLFTSKFYEEQKTLCLISLTVTSLYASNQGKQLNYWHDIIGEQLKAEIDSTPDSPIQSENASLKDCQICFPQILELNNYPELQSHLLKVLEVATSFLDKMKLSNTSREASLYATILPKILCDFLPPHNILNKLITEFLNSSQHPYPQAVAYVVNKCFDLLQEKGIQFQIREWCVLSLSNFLQRSHIHESIWLTSCLLVSGSQNQWLKSTFPLLLNRYCAFETIDKAIFYMSVIEFIKQLDQVQLKSVLSTLEAHAKPGTPFEELVNLINTSSKES